MSTHDLTPREGEEQVRELLGEKEKVVGIIRQTSSERHLVAQEYHHEAWAAAGTCGITELLLSV